MDDHKYSGNHKRPPSDGDMSKELFFVIRTALIIVAVLFLILAVASRFTDDASLSGMFRLENGAGLTRYLRSGDFLMTAARIFVILVCFPVHESAHAWTADKLGDHTGRDMGRITLNPFKHLDLFGTITIFLFGVGFAKPVPVNINNFKNRKAGFALTALAGPVSNLILAVLLLLLGRLGISLFGQTEFYPYVYQFLYYASFINVSLAIFNLIPIPPLDGSRLVTAFFPDRIYDTLLKYERYSMLVLFIVLMVLSRMGISPVSAISVGVFNALFQAIG